MAEAVEVAEVAMPEAPVETEAAGEAAAPEAAAEAQVEEASAMEGLSDHQPGEVEEENVADGKERWQVPTDLVGLLKRAKDKDTVVDPTKIFLRKKREAPA